MKVNGDPDEMQDGFDVVNGKEPGFAHAGPTEQAPASSRDAADASSEANGAQQPPRRESGEVEGAAEVHRPSAAPSAERTDPEPRPPRQIMELARQRAFDSVTILCKSALVVTTKGLLGILPLVPPRQVLLGVARAMGLVFNQMSQTDAKPRTLELRHALQMAFNRALNEGGAPVLKDGGGQLAQDLGGGTALESERGKLGEGLKASLAAGAASEAKH